MQYHSDKSLISNLFSVKERNEKYELMSLKTSNKHNISTLKYKIQVPYNIYMFYT